MSFGYQIQEEYCEPNLNQEEILENIPNSQIEIISYESIAPTGEERLVFDLINAPPSHANALRRTLISNVPSIAIEVVGICNNTGVMPDEVLSHRLGLIPINANPTLLEFPKNINIDDNINDPSIILLFGLHVKGGNGNNNFNDYYSLNNKEGELPILYLGEKNEVLSSHLTWIPLPGQLETFKEVKPLHDNIPITKLLPGQEIHLYCRAIKGIGLDHAKFSPVCTVFYRLIPRIEISTEITNKQKELLISTCPLNLFEIDENNNIKIKSSRLCTTCRECLRSSRLSEIIKLGKEYRRYEFTIETIGVRTAPTLVKEAFQILKNRCEELKSSIQEVISL